LREGRELEYEVKGMPLRLEWSQIDMQKRVAWIHPDQAKAGKAIGLTLGGTIYVTWHVQAGTTLNVLQELGGWSDYSMVLRYAHLAPEHLAKHAGNIGTFLGTQKRQA